jgi:hypothetical protein
MANLPRKPTGTSGPLHVTADGAEFLQLEFPKTKEDIEKFIVKAFVANSGSMPLQISEYMQNRQNDFDFSVETAEGPKFLELMEIAPLENLHGSYDKAPSSYKPYDFAAYIHAKINGKSERYRGAASSRICLLVYATDWAFILSETVITLLQHWTAHQSHSFQYIFCFSPIDAGSGIANLIYPTPKDFWKSFSPDAYRENVVHNLSPLKWQSVRS